eukprot:augustus_masked-scaffold_18-processed-gene-3.10-mRNA-1 protein AED:1.00 eAED:1.00 QI:0/0/0/0/1/1/2/0/471
MLRLIGVTGIALLTAAYNSKSRTSSDRPRNTIRLNVVELEQDACWVSNKSLCTGYTIEEIKSLTIEDAKISIPRQKIDFIERSLKSRVKLPHNFVADSPSTNYARMEQLLSQRHRKKDLIDDYGVRRELMEKIFSFWENEYSYETEQKLMNSWNPKSITIEGIKIHYFHFKPKQTVQKASSHKPMMLIHGWPGSVMEFRGVIPLLQKTYTKEVIIPTLPGFGLSSEAQKQGLDICAISFLFYKLSIRLNWNEFICQGGDWGSMVCMCMSAAMLKFRGFLGLSEQPDVHELIGVHINFAPVNVGPWNLLQGKRYLDDFIHMTPYLLQQMTHPHTLGLALGQNPLSLATWYADKFVVWSDPRSDIFEKSESMKAFISTVILYWGNDAVESSMRIYRETLNNKNNKVFTTNIRLGFSIFPFEHDLGFNEHVARWMHNLVFLERAKQGGHFAALENPNEFYNHLLLFLQQIEEHK